MKVDVYGIFKKGTEECIHIGVSTNYEASVHRHLNGSGSSHIYKCVVRGGGPNNFYGRSLVSTVSSKADAMVDFYTRLYMKSIGRNMSVTTSKSVKVEALTISIIEGFDMVAKTLMAKTVEDLYSGKGVLSTTYRCDYSTIDKYLSRNQSWVAGYFTMDCFRHLSNKFSHNIIYDRALPSSWVYDRLYGTGKNVPDELVVTYLDMMKDLDYTIFYVRHSCKESAERIYNSREKVDKLDEFESFEAYWDMYETADKLYTEFFDRFDVKSPQIFYSISNETGDRCVLKPATGVR